MHLTSKLILKTYVKILQPNNATLIKLLDPWDFYGMKLLPENLSCQVCLMSRWHEKRKCSRSIFRCNLCILYWMKREKWVLPFHPLLSFASLRKLLCSFPLLVSSASFNLYLLCRWSSLRDLLTASESCRILILLFVFKNKNKSFPSVLEEFASPLHHLLPLFRKFSIQSHWMMF